MNYIKLLILVCFSVCVSQSSLAQIVDIPDANFKTALLNHNPTIDTNGDSEVQVTEAQNYNGILNVAALEITDLTGLGSFISIVELVCNNNSLTAIELPNSAALQKINCAANSLSELDITQNINLEELQCNGNGLSGLVTSSNSNLQVLNVAANSITELDLSSNSQLKELRLNFNPITNLDISSNISLERFSATYCYSLGNIDFFNNNLLEQISLWHSNQTTIDVSNMANLQLLYLRNLNLTSIDVSNNINLFNLYVTDNSISQIDVSNNINLVYLSIDNLFVDTVDVSNNPNLVWLDLSGYQLTSVNAKNGNNGIFTNYRIDNASSLGSICVDDVDYANANFIKPTTSYFTEICSADDCVAVALNYTQGFEATTQPFIDECWRKLPLTSTSSNYVKTTSTAYSGNNGVGMRISGANEAFLITPELSDFDESKRISFWMYSAEINRINVGPLSDPNDVLTFETYRQISINDGNGYQWREFHIDFENYTGNSNHVAFQLIGGNAFVSIDDFVYETSPNCIAPIDLNTVPYGSEALLDWTDYGSPISWDIEYGIEGFVQGTGTTVNTVTKPTLISNLDPDTDYQFYVRAICGVDNESDWSSGYQFTTVCQAEPVGYNYNFDEGFPSQYYDCWTQYGTAYLNPGGNSPYSEKMVDFRVNNSEGGMVVTPELENLSNDKRIKFWVYNLEGLSGLTVGTVQNSLDEETYTEIQAFDASQLPTNQWVQLIVNFDTFSSNDRFIAIKQVSTDYNARLYMDSFTYQEIPTCLEPSNFEITNLEDTQLDLQWTELASATSWEIEYGESEFATGNGTLMTFNATSGTISNLIADTNYDIYLRSVCSSDDKSDWIPLYNITTACGPITVDYSQNFDVPQMANCWSTIPAIPTGNTNAEEVTASSSYRLFDSGYSARFADYTFENDLYLISPELSDLGSGNNRIKFWLHPRYLDANLIVGTMSNPEDETTFTPHTTILSADMTYRQWKQFVINFDDYTGSDNYVAFRMQLTGDASNIYEFLYLDQFEYSAIPTCQFPTALSNDLIVNGELTLSWEENNGATQWEIEYGEEGFWQSQGTIIQANSNPFNIAGLAINTTYDFYVRAICDSENTSDWSEKTTIDFGCGNSYSLDYTYDFNASTLDDCWSAYEFPSNQSSTSFSMVIDNNFGDDGYSAYLRDTSQYSSSGVLMVSPLFTDLSNDKKIEFYISNYSGGLVVGTMTNPDDYTTFEALATISGDVSANAWEKRIVYLADYNGTDQFIAFKQKKTSSSHGNQVLIDDFTYLQSVICNMPTDLTIGTVYDNSVEILWTESGEENEWEIEYEQVGVFNSDITVPLTTNNFVLENLLEGTEYSIKVRAKCDEDSLYSDWTEEITFFTGCLPVEANYFESFEFENAISPCWTKIVETENTITNIYAVEQFGVNYNGVDRSVYPVTGNQFIRFANNFDNSTDSSDNLILVSRELLDIDNEKRIRIHLISRQGTTSLLYNRSNLHIGTMSDPNDSSTFNLVQTITPDEMNEFKSYERGVVDWKEHTIYFNNYSGNDSYIAIKHGDEFVGSEFFVDDFKFEVIPDCTEPLYPIVLDERYDAVDISWESYENSNSTSWEIEYGFTDFEIGTGTTITVDNSSFFTLQNLLEDTAYDFYIRANCGTSFSDWSVKQTFTTKCQGFEVGYVESFENHPVGFLEHCWTGLMPQVNSSYWDEIEQIGVIDNSLNYTPDALTGDKLIWFLNETNHSLGDNVSEQTILVSPRLIDLDNYKKFSFWMHPVSSAYASPTEIIVGTMSDPDDYTTFTPYYTISGASEFEDEWTKYEIDLSNFYLEDEYIGIRQVAINERQLILFDDFEYTESGCVTPTNLEAAQSGANEITLAWQDNNTEQAPESWEVAYGPVGFSEGGGTIIQADTNPFTIDGLSSFSDYEYRVRAYCNVGDDYSNWSVPYAFTITCEKQAPFYENFDQYDASYQYNVSQSIPNFCWTRNNNQVSGITNTENLVVSPSSSPNVAFINFYGSEQTPVPGVMVSPYLSDFDANKILKIWIRNETTGSTYNKSGVVIGLMSNPMDMDTFVPYTTIEAEEIPRFGKEFLIDFSSYTGNSHHIAILHNQVNDYSLVMFDDIEYKENPTCLEPINVDFVSVSDTNVMISWENYSTSSTFDIEYGAQGFTLGNGTIVQANEDIITVGGLNPETSYEFYVRTNCGGLDVSAWVGPIEAVTSCDIVSLPWVENFNTMSNYGSNILPECWQGDDVWVSSNTNLSAYQVGDGDTHYLYATYDDFDIEAYLISPMFSLEAGTTYTLSFKIRKEAGDYSSQSVKIWTGRGNTTDALDNYINYFGGFDFGFYNYHPVETTFTPVISGDYSFLFDFSFSAPVHTISIDSFSLNGDNDTPIVVTTDTTTGFDFNGTLPQNIILEETENTQCSVFSDEGENVLRMSGGSNAATWFETGNNDLNWIENENNISKVNFEVDATNVSQLFMNFDLKQTFVNIETESLFRVVVNGDILQTFIADNTNVYENIEIDLSPYTGDAIRVSLQHLGRFGGNDSSLRDRAFLDNLSFNQESSLGLDENSFSEFQFHPNPVKDFLTLRNSSAIESVSVLDVMGRTLKTFKPNRENVAIDMSDLPSAMFFVEVHIGNAVKRIKVLKE
ncbi:fibronectin type III domain-containing protein [Winogradskyella sp.]|uniref:fibronectin type III domain-containing protein n=1 Tax=Winogradskyella sp. TaxID=1883156 RepID=UPI0025E2D6C2|nr:fibronectin type III domain-containing protein [Winogradskyella sp.]